jgi:hypothetical protein
MSTPTATAEREAEEAAKERSTCSHCLSRTYRQEECLCPVEPGAPEGDAEDFDEALEDELRKRGLES